MGKKWGQRRAGMDVGRAGGRDLDGISVEKGGSAVDGRAKSGSKAEFRGFLG